MRIVAIDASPTRGVVSFSVETAAQAAASSGADISRVRLSELRIHSCTGCGMCRYTGRCKIPDDLPSLADAIAQADGVIFGMPSYFRHPDEHLRAALERLQHFFPDDRQLVLPGTARSGAPSHAQKRAVIITACNAPEPLATFFGYTTGPIRELRQALAITKIRTIGSLALTGSWGRQSFDDWEHDRASSLGRMLAGKA
ncbi:MAG: flavodoxin family protein [Coriobacteriia bacterium]|nr:flavodoxin family protein [Coriobacteriia bacterium]